MKIKSVFDEDFMPFGRVVDGYDFAPLLQKLEQFTEKPNDRIIYFPSDPLLEQSDIFSQLSNNFYGGMPIQIGYCNGSNQKLNCLEYHRGSELNIVADDTVFLVAALQKVKDGKLDTAEVEAFFVPKETAVQLYETTLHYAPCNAPGGNGFRVIVALPRNTNTVISRLKTDCHEDRLLWACNKWLISHAESDEAKQGAFIGLTGQNLIVE